MPTPNKRGRAGWGVAVLTAVFVAAAFVALFRPLGQGAGAAHPIAAPRVNVARLDESAGDRLMREQATIFDPTPLFLPTRWNAGQRPLPSTVQRQPEQVFADFAPQTVFDEAELALPVSASQVLPKGPLDLFRQPSRDPLVGFGQQDGPLTPLPARFGFVEVQKVGDGSPVLRCKLDRPVVLPAGRLDWRPAEFLVTVTVAGLLGRPVNTASSDVEEVDLFLRDYLSEVLHLGERLDPGTYRVVVGP